MKRAVIFLAGLAVAAASFGADEPVKLANIDGDIRLEMLEQAISPEVRETFEYYDITGNHERELRRQMRAGGIKWDDGKTYDALTTWNVKWKYDYNCTDRGCSAQSFRTTVDISFRYPRWIQPAEASPELVAKWDKYMNNLIVHELGHRNRAVDATAEMAKAVAGMQPAPTRAELDRQIAALTKEYMARMNSGQRDYDADTIHGTTQGAVFP